MSRRRRRIGSAVVALAVIATAGAAAAQTTYPDHTVRIVVPTAPAGAIDGVGHAVGAKLAER